MNSTTTCILALFTVALLGVTTSWSIVDPSDDNDALDEQMPDLSPREMLDLHRERWIQNKPSDYRYWFEMSGEIAPELEPPFLITVQDDTVSAVVYALGAETMTFEVDRFWTAQASGHRVFTDTDTEAAVSSPRNYVTTSFQKPPRTSSARRAA